MDNLAKPTNRALFLVSVAVTGALAGAAVWLFFFAMEHGMDRDSARAGRRFARACQRPVWLSAVPVFYLPAGRPVNRSVRKDDRHQDR